MLKVPASRTSLFLSVIYFVCQTKLPSNESANPTPYPRGPRRTARDPRSPLRIGANYAITSMGDIVALQCDGQSVAQQPQTKPHSNESTTPTLKPLRVDRAPALRGVGLCAVAHGAWGLGAVTPADRGAVAAQREQQ